MEAGGLLPWLVGLRETNRESKDVIEREQTKLEDDSTKEELGN